MNTARSTPSFPRCSRSAATCPRAEALQRSSFQMWTLYGIEPDTLDYIRLATPDAGYPLRPEIIESTYYLHHLTGDPIYLHMGQDYFDSLVRWCRTPEAYAALTDVRTKQQKDEMESFFFAETLKYLYLLYAPRDTVDWTEVRLQHRSPSAEALHRRSFGLELSRHRLIQPVMLIADRGKRPHRQRHSSAVFDSSSLCCSSKHAPQPVTALRVTERSQIVRPQTAPPAHTSTPRARLPPADTE